MHKLSRRNFLTRSSLLAAGAALGRVALAAPATVSLGKVPLASEPHIHFPSDPRQRISVASWPFRAWIEAPTNRWARKRDLPGMDLKDFAAMVAEKFDIHNIEPLSDHFRSTDAAYLAEFRAAVDKAGSHVIDVPVGGRNSFYDPDAAKRDLAVDYGKRWVDVAVALG